MGEIDKQWWKSADRLGEKASVEIVAHGEGLKLLIKSNEAIAVHMKKSFMAGVKFSACENTMKKQNILKAQLFEFSTTADSGIAEIIRTQEGHWSYIRN